MLPVLGAITIRDTGTGTVFTTTFDSVNWSCSASLAAPPTVTCTDVSQDFDFNCPRMALGVVTQGGVAQGLAECTAGLATKLAIGFDADAKSAPLGEAETVKCIAGGIGGSPIPPYQVLCGDPGVELGLARVLPIVEQASGRSAS